VRKPWTEIGLFLKTASTAEAMNAWFTHYRTSHVVQYGLFLILKLIFYTFLSKITYSYLHKVTGIFKYSFEGVHFNRLWHCKQSW